MMMMMMRPGAGRHKLLSPWKKVRIFNSKAKSVLLYGSDYLETNKEDHRPSTDFPQPYASVYLRGVVAKEDLHRGSGPSRRGVKFHTETETGMDRPHFEGACAKHNPPVS